MALTNIMNWRTWDCFISLKETQLFKANLLYSIPIYLARQRNVLPNENIITLIIKCLVNVLSIPTILFETAKSMFCCSCSLSLHVN